MRKIFAESQNHPSEQKNYVHITSVNVKIQNEIEHLILVWLMQYSRNKHDYFWYFCAKIYSTWKHIDCRMGNCVSITQNPHVNYNYEPIYTKWLNGTKKILAKVVSETINTPIRNVHMHFMHSNNHHIISLKWIGKKYPVHKTNIAIFYEITQQ